ncbi:hypothetical protein [Tepidibacter hydrothermalis]|uniref:Uncharacterized protein n=1 Tax=Tepidibacter hydrothermalis TaxID=3036126 RepID=A0ABY8EK28_9FIRM|nr:hypothetical protein [Tepidibacter hydrothermalis]WFD11398.1 hypothetical protein P4S50_04795 [Tepidibacter hydrothermalis]
MLCPSCSNTKVYTKRTRDHHEGNCCDYNSVGCEIPQTYDTNLIKGECIFVEKVYDAIVFRKEAEYTPDPSSEEKITFTTTLDPSTDKVVEFQDITVSCSSTNLFVEPEILSINGRPYGDLTTNIPGPAGDKIDLSFINTSECDAKGKNTQITVSQYLNVYGSVDLEMSGTALMADGSTKAFTGTETVTLPETIKIHTSAVMCIPSTATAMKPALTEFCAVISNFDAIGGLAAFEQDNTNYNLINATASIVFCISCEKKIIAPVQLCVLSTGFCKAAEYPSGFCEEYPPLFPGDVPYDPDK